MLSEDGEPALAAATHDLEESGLPTRVSTAMVAWLQCHAALVFALGVSVEPRSLQTLLRTPEPLLLRMLRRLPAGESARVAMFGHANAACGRDEIGTQARVLDGIVRTSGLPLPNWERLLPYFDRPGSIDPIPDGSRKLRLRIW